MACYGLILCGGQSTRMGTDKAFITYHKQPQWLHLYEMLSGICDEVLISCNLSQVHHFNDSYKTVVDHPLFKDAGPLTGLLSAFHLHPDVSLLVVGCDYPKIEAADLLLLRQHEDESLDVVCYRNKVIEIDEPLLAWYHPSAFMPMLTAYNHEQTSLRKLIPQLQVQRIIPEEWNRLFSVDTPEDKNKAMGSD